MEKQIRKDSKPRYKVKTQRKIRKVKEEDEELNKEEGTKCKVIGVNPEEKES